MDANRRAMLAIGSQFNWRKSNIYNKSIAFRSLPEIEFFFSLPFSFPTSPHSHFILFTIKSNLEHLSIVIYLLFFFHSTILFRFAVNYISCVCVFLCGDVEFSSFLFNKFTNHAFVQFNFGSASLDAITTVYLVSALSVLFSF